MDLGLSKTQLESMTLTHPIAQKVATALLLTFVMFFNNNLKPLNMKNQKTIENLKDSKFEITNKDKQTLTGGGCDYSMEYTTTNVFGMLCSDERVVDLCCTQPPRPIK